MRFVVMTFGSPRGHLEHSLCKKKPNQQEKATSLQVHRLIQTRVARKLMAPRIAVDSGEFLEATLRTTAEAGCMTAQFRIIIFFF